MHSDKKKGVFLFIILVNLIFNTLVFEAKAEANIDTSSRKQLLFTGFEYTKGIILYNESPFFISLNAIPGRVKYQGEWYDDLLLKYDCNMDVLVLIDQQKNREIELMSEKLLFTL